MDSRHVEQLLEKYWNCETSLEEEQELRAFFRGDQVPSALKDTADLFKYFDEEKGKGLEEKFETTVTKQLRQRRGGKVISMVSFRNVARIAAGIGVLVVATYFIRNEIRKSYPPELQDTYTDPQLAFEETKKALQMISGSFGKARRQAGKMKMFNEAEKKIQTKQSGTKTNI